MAIINLENIAATASITIQLIKDYSMYTSEIISSNGTIFQSTDTDTTLTLKVYKGVEDITNKIVDVEWTRFYFSNDELVEDKDWGKNKKDKLKVVLYKDEIEEKSIIQASGYSDIEGHRELVTTARLTMIKISDIYISDVTPVDPSDKMMWMDTNQTPPTLKIWSDDLGYWISSGMDVPIVKNLIKNSNFWTTIDDYYDIVESDDIYTPARVSYQNKQWAKLESRNRTSQSGGISQTIDYPINKNSNYIFSLIGYRDSSANYSSTTTVRIIIESINDKNETKELIDGNYDLNTSITTVSVPFTTENDTEQIVVKVLTRSYNRCLIYVTELSLYNSSVYYPWELCPDDVDKQMNTKLDNSRTSVFNTLTDNGNFKAIYESENQYYVRAEYITPTVAEQTALDALTSRVDSMDKNNGSNNSNVNKKISELETKVQTLETNVQTLETNYNTLLTQYNNLSTQHTTDVTNLNNLITALTARVAALESSNGDSSNTPSQN